jgi:outer membrane biosynthesis protein TonB
VVAQAVSGSRLGHIVTAIRLIKRRRQTSDFVAPTPIRPSSPEVPANLRHSLKQEVTVDVKVYVSPSGEVQYAELVSDGTGADRDIASLALFESRRWKFHPAQAGGRPSDGEVILHYRFSPEISNAKHE